MFITFEGGEGCGKSTHVKLLKEYLESQGRSVIQTKEPGGTPLGATLRQILLDPETSVEIMSEIFLFAADRIEHVEKVIRPALTSGKIVISDRYMDSTLAYQLGGRFLPEDMVRYINWISSRGIVPDLTFYLEIKVADGLKRAKDRGPADRFEKEIFNFHERVRDKYLEIAASAPDRIKMVETYKSIEEVQQEIRKYIKL